MMTAMVDLRLLLPAGAAASLDERPAKACGPGAARCLFGRPDPGATAQLLRDQLELERDRLLWRFGFDVAAALADDASVPTPELGGQTPPVTTAAPAVRRPRPTPYHRQSSVKDFFRVQKAPGEKKLEAMMRSPEAAHPQASAD